MGFALAPGAVSELAARPFVQRALANPFQPTSVLSFFLGVDYADPKASEILREGECLNDISSFWFFGGEEYDKLCQPFCPVVKDAGKKSLPKDPWDTTLDGKVAQIVLCDQLSRNCFRGQEQAFQNDKISHTISLDLAKVALSDECESTLEGEFYPCYAIFIAITLQHSEDSTSHEKGVEMIDWAKQRSSSKLDGFWDRTLAYHMEHKAVIDCFGRYPHRNEKLGRKSTPEELAYLANVDELPEWAKSQDKK